MRQIIFPVGPDKSARYSSFASSQMISSSPAQNILSSSHIPTRYIPVFLFFFYIYPRGISITSSNGTSSASLFRINVSYLILPYFALFVTYHQCVETPVLFSITLSRNTWQSALPLYLFYFLFSICFLYALSLFASNPTGRYSVGIISL